MASQDSQPTDQKLALSAPNTMPMRSSKRRRKTLTQQSDVDDNVSVYNVSVYNIYKDPPYKEADLKSPSYILNLLKNSQTLTPRQDSSIPLPAIRGPPPTVPGVGRGVVAGKLIYRMRGVVADCSKWPGIMIPRTDRIEYMTADDARFILLVGNISVFMMLLEDMFYNRFPCIIVSAGEGPPDFLIEMNKEFKLPVLALVDSDPYWLKILAFYARKLNDIKWLGIRPSDAITHKMEELHLTLPMTKKDIKSCRDMVKDDFLKSRPEWLKELKIMVESKQKVEVEPLGLFGDLYLPKVFLPMKLQLEDWI